MSEQRMVVSYAVFTATPINRGATDLLALVELLGADNFPDETLASLEKLMKLRRTGGTGPVPAARHPIRGR